MARGIEQQRVVVATLRDFCSTYDGGGSIYTCSKCVMLSFEDSNLLYDGVARSLLLLLLGFPSFWYESSCGWTGLTFAAPQPKINLWLFGSMAKKSVNEIFS